MSEKQKKKPSMVKLVVKHAAKPDGKKQIIQSREFNLAHAERLLSRENNGGWELAEDSNFKFDKKNGLSLKSGKTES